MKKSILVCLIFVALPSMAQIVDQSRSNVNENRDSSSYSSQGQYSASIGGTFFGLLGLIETRGAEVLGYSREQIDREFPKFIDAVNQGGPDAPLPVGLNTFESMKMMCETFKRRSYSYSHVPQFAERIRNDERTRNVSTVTDNQMMIQMGLGDELAATNYSERIFGKTVQLRQRFMCLGIQAAVIEQALKKLREVKPSRFAIPDMNQLKAALRYGGETWQTSEAAKMVFGAWPADGFGCQVPTPTGLQQGKRTVYCGPMEYDQEARRFMYSGMVVLDSENISGRHISFIESDGFEKSKANVKSSGKKSSARIAE